MLRKIAPILFLVVCVCSSLPVAAADVPTIVIPERQADDQFDRDFEDDFDQEFADQGETDGILIADPLEGFNRGMFYLNDKLYMNLMKPVVRGYRSVVPRPARTSVNNFFTNLATPIRIGNALLQFQFKAVGSELYRLIVNSTVGIGGLFDPAAALVGLRKTEEDFGQTLGVYGFGHGFYLVLPIMGPSSLRDTIGHFGDAALDPFTYAGLGFWEYLGVKSFRVTNSISLDPDTYEGIVRDALDPYLFIRAAYVQRRMALVAKRAYTLESQQVNPLNWLGM